MQVLKMSSCILLYLHPILFLSENPPSTQIRPHNVRVHKDMMCCTDRWGLGRNTANEYALNGKNKQCWRL
ncbi:hypothetical protein H5410_002113 [Solanum commersonii]|uniref:Secreted protein n=1 Tax=Solanum commersonii TaxID=4109 RepID=A0A9J6B157_SOLCO|nr:hypothetical protein H5410_002113 [Solanum commersonii]